MIPFYNSSEMDRVLDTYVDKGPFSRSKIPPGSLSLDPGTRSRVHDSALDYSTWKPKEEKRLSAHSEALKWAKSGKPAAMKATEHTRALRKAGLLPHVELEVLVRTSSITPWMVEKYLAQTASMSITVGIHKSEDRRVPATPKWSFSYRSPEKGEEETHEYNLDEMSLEELIESCKLESARTPVALIPSGVGDWELYYPVINRSSVSNAHLGATREFGDWSNGTPPRPWLEPAINENRALITGLWGLALKRTFRGAIEVNTMGNWIVIGGSAPRFVGKGDIKSVFMGPTSLKPYAPSGGGNMLNFRREMMQAFRPFLAALENLTQDSLMKSGSGEPLHQFTIDYKEYGGQHLHGGRIISSSESTKPGVFTGQLKQAIRARFAGSYTYPLAPNEMKI